MYADICEPEEIAKLNRFRDVLRLLNAEFIDESFGMGVKLYEFRIGSETLTVFSDSWSIDVEGSPELLARINALMNQDDSADSASPASTQDEMK